MSAATWLFESNWGEVQVGGTRVSTRLVVTLAGTAVWLALTLIETGSDGVTAIWTALAFLLPLIVIGSITRSVNVWTLTSMFLAGGFMMGLMLLGSEVFEVFEDDPNAGSRDFVIPAMEEVFKIAPVLLMLWVWRSRWTWTLGATDLLLMGAAAGAGFGLVEDAYIRERSGWGDSVAFLPITEEFGGRLIAGHAIWTALAGLTIGLGLLLRSRGGAALAVACSGIAWSAMDHIRNNYSSVRSDGFADFLNGISADGYVTLYLLIAGVIAVIAADLAVSRGVLPAMPDLQPPAAGQTAESVGRSWEFRLQKRALAYAGYQIRRLAEPQRPAPKAAMDALLASLLASRSP